VPAEKIRDRVIISGIVQGVGYRFFTQKEAHQQGVMGWVRNLPDGRVEAVFEGFPEAVKAMVQWCHQGPQNAVVQQVVVEPEEPEGIKGFEILR
jgi:acylphosphatase